MDDIDRKLVGLLAIDSRRALAELGAAVGLSTSAVNERIRRLSTAGAIRRFTIDADPEALGLGILAFVWVGLSADADEASFRAFAASHPAVVECHHVTGPWSYLIKIRVGTLDGVGDVSRRTQGAAADRPLGDDLSGCRRWLKRRSRPEEIGDWGDW